MPVNQLGFFGIGIDLHLHFCQTLSQKFSNTFVSKNWTILDEGYAIRKPFIWICLLKFTPAFAPLTVRDDLHFSTKISVISCFLVPERFKNR